MWGVIHINLSKNWRGGERQVALLMMGLQDIGVHQVLICTRNSSLHKYCKASKLPYRSFYSVGLFFYVPFLIAYWYARKKYDLVHCHESRGHTLAFLARYFLGSSIKTVVHRRVLFPIRSKRITLLKYSPKYVDRVVCISKVVEQVVKEAVPQACTKVIPSGVPLSIKEGDNDFDLRRIYGIPSLSKIVAYVAALTHEKDHRTFLDTAKIVLGVRDDVHFIIVGDGVLFDELSSYVLELGIERNVHFTGFQKHIHHIIWQTDLLLFTSRSEGLGSTILDYFVHRRPVISAKNGGAEELIVDGQTGFLCPKGDALCFSEKLLDILWNDKEVQRITQNAFAFVQRSFSTEIVVEQTLNLYRELEF